MYDLNYKLKVKLKNAQYRFCKNLNQLNFIKITTEKNSKQLTKYTKMNDISSNVQPTSIVEIFHLMNEVTKKSSRFDKVYNVRF